MVDPSAPVFRDRPTKLYVETTTRCNLRCGMCVKQSLDGGIADSDMPAEIFDALKPAFLGLEALILSGIGEPLLHPRLEDMIRSARSLMPRESSIGFQSNGLLLTEKRARSLVDAGLDRICISVDAVTEDVFGEIREGGGLRAVESAMGAINEARAGRPHFKAGIEFVAMRRNIGELDAVLRWASARGLDFALVTQVLPYQKGTVEEAVYDPNTDAAVAFFEPWRCRARAEGIAIERYFEVLWNYKKTPEEEAIVDFVERMKADAHSRDIFFNVQKMLARDEEWVGEMEAAFARARKTADELKLDVWLPEVVPQSARRCDFVEGGSAFVSVAGEVHPCYFLWHAYRCFINGREKSVTPRTFGRVPDRGILDIWNEPAFAAFRESVVRYDYPYCSDCNLSKCCDYVSADEFERDCYLNEEPCGDCLWCKGVFKCLG